MDVWQTAVVALAGAVLLLILVLRFLLGRLRRQRKRVRELKSRYGSLATTHGRVIEQFAPFLADWPWDPKDFRFLGSPIDGLQFTDDAVIIVEIKTGKSKLSDRQRAIKDLVRKGRVEWREVRI